MNKGHELVIKLTKVLKKKKNLQKNYLKTKYFKIYNKIRGQMKNINEYFEKHIG